MNNEKLAVSLQQDLLTLTCHDNEHGKIISKTVSSTLFEGDYRTIFERALAFWQQHNVAPKQHIADLLADILEDKQDRRGQTYQRILVQMIEVKDLINIEFVLRSMNQFIRMQRAKEIILQSAEQLDARGINGLGDVENLIRRFLLENQTSLDAGLRLSNIDKVLDYLNASQSEFMTGIKEFDQNHIVPMRGKLWLFMAPAKKGKCIAEGECVLLADGRYIPIEKIKDGEYVPSYDLHSQRFFPRKAYLAQNGRKEVFCVTTRSGRTVTLTSKHPLLTKENGWKTLSKLKVGDKIAAPAEVSVFGNGDSFFELMRILGYLIADGGLTGNSTPTFTKQDPIVLEDMKACLAKFDCKLKPVRFSAIDYYVVSKDGGKGKQNKICTILRNLGMLEKAARQKFIPEFIFTLRKELIAEFLAALFSCDGSVYGKGTGQWVFEYCSTSKVLAEQVNHLLMRFGIVCKIQMGTQTISGRPYYSWTVATGERSELKKIDEEIGLFSYKGDLLKKVLLMDYDQKTNRNGISRDRRGDLFFDKIVEIKSLGFKNTYDLMVEGTHNFVAGNLLVHNTWMLIQLGKMAFLQRKKIVHISLEIEAEEVAQRYYQSLFGASKRDDVSKISRLHMDNRGQLDRIVSESVEAPFTFRSDAIREELQTRISHFGMRADNIYIKRFPMSSLTIEQLEAYLESLEAVEKFIPDLVILDYPKIMKLNVKELRVSLGALFEGLRGMSQRRNFALAAVHQGNRSSDTAELVKASAHLSEDWSIAGTVDFLITYSQTAAEKRKGLARLFVDLARSEQDKFGVLITQSYKTGQFVLESTRLNDSYAHLMEAMGTEDEEEDSAEEG